MTEYTAKHGAVIELTLDDVIISPTLLNDKDGDELATSNGYSASKGSSFTFGDRKTFHVRNTGTLRLIESGDGRYVYEHVDAKARRLQAELDTLKAGTPAPNPTGPRVPLGCNIGSGSMGSGKLGLFTDYNYPTDAELDLARDFDMRVLRWNFRFARFMDRNGNPDVKSIAQNEKQLDRALAMGFERIIVAEHGYGLSIAHRDASNNQTSVLLSVDEVPLIVQCLNTALAKYKNNERISIGLVNEPYQLGDDWYQIAQALIDALRADGWTNELVISTTGYSPLRNLASKIDRVKQWRDPLNKLVFDVHQYFDKDSAGNSYNETMGLEAGATEADAEAWIARTVQDDVDAARAAGIQLLLGEYGFANTETGRLGARVWQRYLNANADVFKYATWWILSSYMPMKNSGGYYGLSAQFGPSPLIRQLRENHYA